MNYTFRGGDRPLDGFTIKCGVGRGAFGEVYVAESEGGKFVALKLLTDHSELELRGIAQCLNLKHANLVHLYDLRTDSQGRKWVVMEYVIGESLARTLDRHPNGLSPQLAKDWAISLARAVGYLHDKLVVHRDLKPANIFVEDGQVKVGDFGLCKRMLGSSHRAAHSQGVGTVYYMAPEVEKGQYTKAVDVYAAGVILYEMLTGAVPFTGDSPLEILHRHVTDAPDMAKVPAAFRPVIEKAMAKDPKDRYATMADFARAVEAVPVAGEARLSAAVPVSPPGIVPTVALPVRAPAGPLTTAVRSRLTELVGGFAAAPLIAAFCLLVWLIFSPTIEWATLAHLFLLTAALSWGVLLFGRFDRRAEGWAKRARLLLVGLAVGGLGFWLEGTPLPHPMTAADADAPYREQYLGGSVRVAPEVLSLGMTYLVYYGLACALFRWWTVTDRCRPVRCRLFPVLAMGFWGTVLLILWTSQPGLPTVYRAVPLVLSVVAVQWVAPWTAPPPPEPRRYRMRAA